MDSNSGQAISIWMATAEVPGKSSLTENTHSDVCIVGAGIAGMTTAYLLAREGRSVIVLDDGRTGGEMTKRTTAHPPYAIDFEIERIHGEKGARLAARSHTATIDRIEAIVAEEEIDCDFERLDGCLFVPPGRQAQFHPLKYLTGLSRAIERDGGRIFSGTHASNIEGGAHARVETHDGYVVTADAIVIAINTPVNDIVTIHTKQASYTTYVIGARIPRGSITRALYWDTADPYHYARVQSVSAKDGDDYDLLIVGVEDHKSGQEDDGDQRYAHLEEWARERFPMIERIEMRWSGQVLGPVDGLAFIGRNPGDQQTVYIITGDSGMGMTQI